MPSPDVIGQLLALNLSLIPVEPGGKVPAVRWKEFQESPADAGQLEQWFGNSHGYNIGIVTGAVSGVVVVDLDSPAAEQWAEVHLPRTPMRTRTAKGRHDYYRHPGTPVRNAARIKSADQTIELDVRGDGGYVVGPGSVHETGARYEMIRAWPDSLDALPVFDPAWLAMEERPSSNITGDTSPTPATRHVRRARERGDRKELLSRARAYLRATPPAVQGEGGDTHTYQVVCRIVRGFDLAESDARELLLQWNAGCVPPWSERELDEKIAAALKYGTEPIGARAEGSTSRILPDRITEQDRPDEVQTDQPVSSALPDFLARASTMPARDELLPGLVAKRETALIHGEPRALKTWSVLEIGVSLATATPAFGLLTPPAAARVLYITNEDSIATIGARLQGLLTSRGLEHAPEGFRLIVSQGVALDDADWQAKLIDEVRQFDIDLVILDPLRSVTLSVDQGPREFQPFGLYLRQLISETGCGVLCTHHDTKPQAGVTETRRRAQRSSGGGLFGHMDARSWNARSCAALAWMKPRDTVELESPSCRSDRRSERTSAGVSIASAYSMRTPGSDWHGSRAPTACGFVCS